MNFDEAIATTFSLDPFFLLEAIVHLALMAQNDQTDLDSLAALDKFSRKLTVFTQRGRILVPGYVSPVFGLLEEMIVEVTAPNNGVFHPKVWAIRFVDPAQGDSLYRLAVLTRNLTRDCCWDLSLQLEGVITDRKQKMNRPLEHFFSRLPELAVEPIDEGRREQAKRFAEELLKVKWELPDGYEELNFYLPGERKFAWKPPEANRAVVISPFCSDKALRELTKTSKIVDALISRQVTLSALRKDTLNLFANNFYLDEAAETDDGEDVEAGSDYLDTNGLHAKVYLYETKHYTDYTHVVMGSANATNSAFGPSKNIEILVELVGKRSIVMGIDFLLGPEGLGPYLVNFDTVKETQIDASRQEAEKYLKEAHSLITGTPLSIKCYPGAKYGLWSLMLVGEIPDLRGLVSATAWPITVNQDCSVNVLVGSRKEISLGEFSPDCLTGLISFELTTNHPDVTRRFVLNLPTTGIPEERTGAILRTKINNKDGFMTYLLLLLDNNIDSALEHSGGSRFAKRIARMADGNDIALLEEMTRAFNRHPEKLKEVAGLIQNLSLGNGNHVIPEGFLDLWAVFEAAIERKV
jgi:hypothetical protein